MTDLGTPPSLHMLEITLTRSQPALQRLSDQLPSGLSLKHRLKYSFKKSTYSSTVISGSIWKRSSEIVQYTNPSTSMSLLFIHSLTFDRAIIPTFGVHSALSG